MFLVVPGTASSGRLEVSIQLKVERIVSWNEKNECRWVRGNVVHVTEGRVNGENVVECLITGIITKKQGDLVVEF